MRLDESEMLHDFPPDPAMPGHAGDMSFLRATVVSDRTRFRIPSRVDWIELAVMHLANKAHALGACDHDRHGKIVTALTEALTNAIVHGNLGIPSALKEQPGAFAQTLALRANDPAFADRPVDVDMSYDGQRCTWTITDRGAGFDFAETLRRLDAPDPTCDPESPEFDPSMLLCSGRGILLIRAFMDDVSWSDDGRTIRLTIDKDPEGERRAAPRVQASEPVRAAPLDDAGRIDWDRAFDALATDLSTGGIGLLRHGLADGTPGRLVLELEVDGQTLYVPAEVCHVHPVAEGDPSMVQIGCRFTVKAEDPAEAARLGEQQRAIAGLIDRLSRADTAPRHDERRAHPRIAYTRTIHLELDHGHQQTAVARDLSKSGLAFVTEFPLALGTTFDAILEPTSDEPLRLRARVTRCNHVAGPFHDVGCQFME